MTGAELATVLDPRYGTFFDWGSVSPLCKPGMAARDACLRRLDAAPHPATRLRDEHERLSRIRATAGELVGAPPGWSIVFGRSVSALFSLLAMGLPGGGTRRTVVLTDTEHPAGQLAWAGAAAHRPGLEPVVLPPAGDGTVDLDALERVLDERCLAVCCAHLTRLSGIGQPVRELAALAHRVGALVIVDGAQAVGRIPVDVAELGADIYLGSGRKSLLGPTGTAFLAATSALLERVRPVSWSSDTAMVSHVDGRVALLPRDLPGRLETGLPDPAALSALEASIRALLRLGVPAVARHVAGLTPPATELFGAAGLHPRHGVRATAGILTFDLRPHGVRGQRLAAMLAGQGFATSAYGCLLRVCLHLANRRTDIVAVAEAVRRNLR